MPLRGIRVRPERDPSGIPSVASLAFACALAWHPCSARAVAPQAGARAFVRLPAKVYLVYYTCTDKLRPLSCYTCTEKL